MAEELTTPGQIHRQQTQKIFDQLNKLGIPVTQEEITPVTDETPVRISEDLLSMGAHIIGEGREVGTHFLFDTAHDAAGGNPNIRVNESKSWRSQLIDRVIRRNREKQVQLT